MKKRSLFDFMPPPGEEYYKDLKMRVTEILTEKQIEAYKAALNNNTPQDAAILPAKGLYTSDERHTHQA